MSDAHSLLWDRQPQDTRTQVFPRFLHQAKGLLEGMKRYIEKGERSSSRSDNVSPDLLKLGFELGVVGLRVLIPLILGCFVLAACGRSKGPEHFYFGHYSEAEKHYNKGEYEEAIGKYQAYIDENPEGNLAVISQYYIAKSHAALGHKDEARGIYQDITQQYPDLVWAKFAERQLNEL